MCLAAGQFFDLAQFVFVVAFCTFLIECVDYDVLFKKKPPPSRSIKQYGDKLTVGVSHIYV